MILFTSPSKKQDPVPSLPTFTPLIFCPGSPTSSCLCLLCHISLTMPPYSEWKVEVFCKQRKLGSKLCTYSSNLPANKVGLIQKFILQTKCKPPYRRCLYYHFKVITFHHWYMQHRFITAASVTLKSSKIKIFKKKYSQQSETPYLQCINDALRKVYYKGHSTNSQLFPSYPYHVFKKKSSFKTMYLF